MFLTSGKKLKSLLVLIHRVNDYFAQVFILSLQGAALNCFKRDISSNLRKCTTRIKQYTVNELLDVRCVL